MSAKFNNLRKIAVDAVEGGVVPGLVVAVGTGGKTVLCEAFGAREVAPDPPRATPETVYDLASLTKALATSILVMRAVAAGQLALDERLGEAFSLCTGRPCADATVREALAHATGLPAHRPFHERVAGRPPEARRHALLELVAAEPLAHPTGSRSLYSDLGFILLGALLEARLGAPLDALFAREVAAPLGLSRLGYAPPEGAPLAPTERCPVRGRLVLGEVHDLNAAAMGGVAGHAGLFGTAPAVAVVAEALCAAYAGATSFIPPDILRAFFSPAGVPASTWRLGWDGPAKAGSLAGERLAKRAVGHLAFTGCSLWIDPDPGVFVVVLSNRVHPAVRDDPRFRALRPAVNDAALEGLDYRG